MIFVTNSATSKYKGLDVAVGAQAPGGENDEFTAWAGTNSAPVMEEHRDQVFAEHFKDPMEF